MFDSKYRAKVLSCCLNVRDYTIYDALCILHLHAFWNHCKYRAISFGLSICFCLLTAFAFQIVSIFGLTERKYCEIFQKWKFPSAAVTIAKYGTNWIFSTSDDADFGFPFRHSYNTCNFAASKSRSIFFCVCVLYANVFDSVYAGCFTRNHLLSSSTVVISTNVQI